jgi:hypothetical protein
MLINNLILMSFPTERPRLSEWKKGRARLTAKVVAIPIRLLCCHSQFRSSFKPPVFLIALFEPCNATTQECLDKYSANHGTGLEMNLFSAFGVVVIGERDT